MNKNRELHLTTEDRRNLHSMIEDASNCLKYYDAGDFQHATTCLSLATHAAHEIQIARTPRSRHEALTARCEFIEWTRFKNTEPESVK